MDNLNLNPETVALIIGTFVVSKSDMIIDFIKNFASKEAKTATLEQSITQIQKDIGKIEAANEKLQKDLNELFRKIK